MMKQLHNFKDVGALPAARLGSESHFYHLLEEGRTQQGNQKQVQRVNETFSSISD